MNDHTKKWCDSLRDMADFFESYGDTLDWIPAVAVNLFVGTAEDMAEMGRKLGTSSKHEQGSYYFLQKNFGSHSIQLNILRDKICEKVLVGTKKVMKPALDAVMVEVLEPVYEWNCPDSVLSGGLASDLSGDEPG